MAEISVVNVSQLQQSGRLDPEPYGRAFFINEEALDSLSQKAPVIKLKSIISQPVITGHTPKIREPNLDGTDALFVKTDILRKGFIRKEKADLISDEGFQKIKRASLKKDDVIVTIIGATYEIIGRAALIFDDLGKACINQNIALIRSNLKYPGFLLSFINSKYGYYQLCRLSRQTEQVNLNCREVEELRIPLFSEKMQKQIHELVTKAHEELTNSVRIYTQAERMLLEELGLKDVRLKYDLSYAANLLKAFEAHRIDAEHFQPAYDEVTKKVLNFQNGYTQLSNYAKNVNPDFDPSDFPVKTFSYVELANIDPSIGVIDSVSEVKGEEAPSRARRVLRKDDVIVSSVEGSLEKVALVDKEHEGSLASTGFFQLRPRKIHPEVLLVLSKSIVLQAQLKKECAGTILTAVPKDSLKRIVVPIIPNETQEKIVLIVQQSHEARRKAKGLLETAKRQVEETIEKAR